MDSKHTSQEGIIVDKQVNIIGKYRAGNPNRDLDYVTKLHISCQSLPCQHLQQDLRWSIGFIDQGIIKNNTTHLGSKSRHITRSCPSKIELHVECLFKLLDETCFTSPWTPSDD